MEMLNKHNCRSLLLSAYDLIVKGERSKISFDTPLFTHRLSLTKKGNSVHLFTVDTASNIMDFSTMLDSYVDIKDVAISYAIGLKKL